MTDEHKAFQAAIAAAPDDEAPHKGFADWLDEHGEHELAVWHRRWTVEIGRAETWLREFADRIGMTCTNYGENAHQYFAASRGLDFRNEADREQLKQLREEMRNREKWVPITYEDVIQAGHEYIKHGDYLTQYGSEAARDQMDDDATRKQFWHCWSLVTGVDVSPEEREGTVFSCSC